MSNKLDRARHPLAQAMREAMREAMGPIPRGPLAQHIPQHGALRQEITLEDGECLVTAVDWGQTPDRSAFVQMRMDEQGRARVVRMESSPGLRESKKREEMKQVYEILTKAHEQASHVHIAPNLAGGFIINHRPYMGEPELMREHGVVIGQSLDDLWRRLVAQQNRAQQRQELLALTMPGRFMWPTGQQEPVRLGPNGEPLPPAPRVQVAHDDEDDEGDDD